MMLDKLPRRWLRKHSHQKLAAAVLLLIYLVISLRGELPHLGFILSFRGPAGTVSIQPVRLSGFYNDGTPGSVACNKIKHSSGIFVEQSLYLEDNMHQIAKSLDGHPMISYEGQDTSLTHEQIVNKTWDALSGSCAFLEDYSVYLCVTRVIFFTQGVRHWPSISFLRGQIYDEDWVHQENYTLTWLDQEFRFPLVFDIPTEYEEGGGFYGPEDPRIIIEDGVDGAEPVIIFNMMTKVVDWKRPMFLFRPFSNHTAMFRIKDYEVLIQEKNWAPFFHTPESSKSPCKNCPSQYLHFVYGFKPFRVIKCSLLSGSCDWVFEQSVPAELETKHNDDGSMRGGTNFFPIPISGAPGARAYVSLPRTHIDHFCTEGMYRPEIVVMTVINNHFHLSFASEALDFGTAILTYNQSIDPCDIGRILISNSIANWDFQRDVMTATFTVADMTVQVARLHGVLGYLRKLPYLDKTLRTNVPSDAHDSWHLPWSAAGNDVLGCSVEAAVNYTRAGLEISRLIDSPGVPKPKEPEVPEEKSEESDLPEEEELPDDARRRLKRK